MILLIISVTGHDNYVYHDIPSTPNAYLEFTKLLAKLHWVLGNTMQLRMPHVCRYALHFEHSLGNMSVLLAQWRVQPGYQHDQ